ncbi:MAG: hypothetical protein FJ278_01165 [Planctomycetes bacterium]|nr:hypothetical protein [Planctomycetota bacterium]
MDMSRNSVGVLVFVSLVCLTAGCHTSSARDSGAGGTDSPSVVRSLVQVTHGSDSVGFPHVATEGDTIACVRLGSKRAEILTVTVSGPQQTKLISVQGANEFSPVWHRHAKTGKEMIAFTSDRTPTSTIWERDPSGVGAQRQIVSDDRSWHYYEPDVNPVTGKVAFVRSKRRIDQGNPLATLKYRPDCFIMVCNHDGSDLTEFVNGVNPRWSPDGKRLAFARRGLQGNYDIWTIDANGANLTQVTFHPGNEFEPAWSPDGSRIAYAGEKRAGTMVNLDIWIIRTDGGNPVQLTTTDTSEGRPVFARNGDVYFHSFELSGARKVSVWRVTPNLPPEN